jgi:hypothetical protein
MNKHDVWVQFFCCAFHKPKWKTWIYVYLYHALECNQPVIESLQFVIARLFPDYSQIHENFDRERLIANATIKLTNQEEKKKRRQGKNRDASPLRGSDSEEEIMDADLGAVHPIRTLYFPPDPDATKGMTQKIRAVFEMRDNQKWLSFDWTPWGGQKEEGVLRCTPNTPNECMIFDYLLVREVVYGMSPGRWRYPDQRKRYKNFKAQNMEGLKSARAAGNIFLSNHRYLPIGSGIYYDTLPPEIKDPAS